MMTRIILGLGMAFAAFVLVLNVIGVIALACWAWDTRHRRIKRIRPHRLDAPRAGP